MSHALRGRWTAIFLWLGVAGAYVWWVHPLVGRPLLADEAGFAQGAAWRAFGIAPWPYYQPPLFQDLLELWVEWFPATLTSVRWIGVGCFLFQLVLVYALAQRLHVGAGALAALLWVTHPMAIQGSMIVDIDNTVLAVWLTLWCRLWLEASWPLRARDVWALGLVMSLGLWTKLSTPLGLPVLVAWYGIIRREWRAAVRSAGGMAVCGLGCFLLAWVVYQQLHPAWPGDRLLGQNLGGISRGWPGHGVALWRELAQRLPRLLLWIHPVWVLLGIVVWRAQRRPPPSGVAQRATLLWWYVVLLGVGYWVVRGPHYGFAKYHYPLLPVLVALVSAGCVAAGFPTTRRHWYGLLVAGAATGLASYWLVGDVLLLLGQFRTALVAAPADAAALWRALAWRALAGGCLALAVWGAVCWWLRASRQPSRVLVTLLVLALGMGGATDVWQRTTTHSTTYTYGRSLTDMQRMVQWLRRHGGGTPHRWWLAPEDVLIAARLPSYPMARPWWSEARLLAHALADPRVHGLIISPNTQTRWTYRHVIGDPDVQRLLQSFQQTQQGEYTMWMRRP